MKIFKHRNIMGLIYGVILAIPMLSILVRSAYVVVNKNAKDSYGGQIQTQYKSNEVNNLNDIILGNIYCLEFNTTISPDSIDSILVYSDNSSLNTSNYELVKFESSSNDYYYREYPYCVWDFLRINTRTTANDILCKFDSTDDQSNFILYVGNANVYNTKLYLVLNALPSNDSIQYIHESDYLGETVLINGGTLDNAFDYSLSEYVSENSFGNLNFFEWWSNLFLDLNNPKSALYIHFVNWYMNYVLFVSSSYILFMVLMWFINYSRRIMERGLNYDW